MNHPTPVIGKFYDRTGISFPIGNIRCHALKFSFEQLHRSFPSHSHSSNSWEIHYIAYGKGRITLAHIPFQVGPDDLFITGPHMEHSQTPDPDDPMAEYCVYLKFESRNSTLIQGKNPEFLNRFLSTDQYLGQDKQNLHSLMQTLFQELEHRTIGYRTVLEALLTQLLVLIVRDLEVAEHPEPSAEFSLTDRNYLMIEESFLYEYRDLTLEKLASRLALSPRQTERLLDQILETEGDWWLRPPYGAMTQREAAWVETPMIQWTIDPEQFASKARNTPFAGRKVKGKVKYTIVGGNIIYQDSL